MIPLISILIPAYNAERWIADTLRSALAQTWPRKEIVVIDDSSTDRTLSIARAFESDGVSVYSQKHQGAAAARNLALERSNGDYIQWLDADDLLHPEKMSRQMAVIEQRKDSRLLVSGAFGTFFYRRERSKFVETLLWADLAPAEWLYRKLAHDIYLQTATWLTSRELVTAAGPWNTELAVDDDGEYFCRVLLASTGVIFVPEAKVYYRSSGSNALSYVGRSNEKKDAYWQSMKLHMDYLLSLEQSPRVREACVEFMRNSLIYFYPERKDIVLEAERKALEFGGRLGAPRLSWKYIWIKSLFGWKTAKRAQLLLPFLRGETSRLFDKVFFELASLTPKRKTPAFVR